ncbi:MAG: YkgJ family cysteine cluster protein [Candidatus Thorarchaeota archaeon]|nr:YkgJ family cysteine cluster protein [Candidatus Thorarchaeota archaeon]
MVERNSARDGSFEKLRCDICESSCCVETEMTLTKKDAERIDALGYKRLEYLIKGSDNFCELRNIDGHCFFYDPETKLCKIYEARPDGCRYYPVVYNARKRKCVLDDDCPLREKVSRQEMRKVCHKVKKNVETLMMEAQRSDGAC